MSEGVDQRFAAALPDTIDFDDPFRTAKKFRGDWFGQAYEGHALFFLFSKNLSVTNIQFAELLSLLRLHTYERSSGKRAEALYFVTGNEFDRMFVEMIEPFQSEREHLRDTVGLLYSEVFARTVIVDPLFCSCNIFLPPTLITNLAAIAGEAGYIHSCGHLIFVRNVVKADPNLLFTNLNSHLIRYKPQPGKKLRFVVYADEDFTDEDRHDASSLIAGLDDVKIHVEKAWFRTKRLVDVIDALKEKMQRDLVFSAGRGFRSDQADQEEQQDIDRSRTLWLIQDHSVGDPCEQPGIERYYICYDQHFRAQNATYLFDENKPAWQDHTTLPPSLAGALVNIIRRPERADSELCVADPFIGTGTSLLEVLRFSRMTFVGSDNNASSSLLVEDNLRFFRESHDGVTQLFNHLRDAAQEIIAALDTNKADQLADTKVFRIAQLLFGTATLADQARKPDDLPQLSSDRLPDNLGDRVLAYVAMRTSKRHSARFVRSASASNRDWFAKYLGELTTLSRQVADLMELRSRELLDHDATATLLKDLAHIDGATDGIALFHDQYSVGSMPLAQVVEGAQGNSGHNDARFELRVGESDGDARMLPKDSYDVVIGDPPYGFNTAGDARVLAELYRGFASKALLSLRDGGDLVLCLPERSHSGRYSPAFTHMELVVQQLLLTAGEVGRQLIFPRDRVRGAEYLFDADYYWESQRALRRSVLHVQVRRKPQPDGQESESGRG